MENLMSQDKTQILIVDDEPKYVYIMQLNLEASGYGVIIGRDGEEAVTLAASEEPDLIILDIMMPKLTGYQACERIREFSTVPIIFLTAKAEEADKVKGLELGADDYVTKPFSIDEFLARVRAALRRVELENQPQTGAVYEVGALRVDLTRQRVFVNQKEVKLTAIEYSLLSELVKQSGRVVVADHLLEVGWGTGYEGEEQILRQAMYRLRKKIEPDPQHPRYLQTRPGLGYMLATADQEGKTQSRKGQ
jgi:DNA-binding response OmpR family regulator